MKPNLLTTFKIALYCLYFTPMTLHETTLSVSPPTVTHDTFQYQIPATVRIERILFSNKVYSSLECTKLMPLPVCVLAVSPRTNISMF